MPATAHNVDTKMPASEREPHELVVRIWCDEPGVHEACSYASPAAILSALSIRNVEYFPSDGRLCVPKLDDLDAGFRSNGPSHLRRGSQLRENRFHAFVANLCGELRQLLGRDIGLCGQAGNQARRQALNP